MYNVADGANRPPSPPPPLPPSDAGAFASDVDPGEGASALGARIAGVRGADSGEGMQTTGSLFHDWTLLTINGDPPVIKCMVGFKRSGPDPGVEASGRLNGNEISGDGEYIDPSLIIPDFTTSMAAFDDDSEQATA